MPLLQQLLQQQHPQPMQAELQMQQPQRQQWLRQEQLPLPRRQQQQCLQQRWCLPLLLSRQPLLWQ